MELAKSVALDTDPTNFWKIHGEKFPRLAMLVQVLFSLSPTSAEAERSFSISGDLLRSKRSSMNPMRASKVLFVNSNINYIKDFDSANVFKKKNQAEIEVEEVIEADHSDDDDEEEGN